MTFHLLERTAAKGLRFFICFPFDAAVFRLDLLDSIVFLLDEVQLPTFPGGTWLRGVVGEIGEEFFFAVDAYLAAFYDFQLFNYMEK